MADDKKQTLHGSNRSANIAEALSARVKDPLWFLARQWQTGEFEAENGGLLAEIELQSRHFPVRQLRRGSSETKIDPADILEALVEAEDPQTGDAPAWHAAALEYRFDLETTGQRFKASDYAGFQLDWFQFDLEKDARAGAIEDEPQVFTPTHMTLRGAPDPRWWRMEDGEAYFDSPREPEPNVLSTLLPEFFYTDVNNWYMIPAPMPAGSVREITSLKVTDSFGVTVELKPVEDEDWTVFAVDGAADGDKGLSGAALFSPNVALDVLHNDVIEDVRFVRDEQANLVWAWEHSVTDANGVQVINGDQVPSEEDVSEPSPAGYRLMSEVPGHWIPYVPFQINPGAANGEIGLRRGRTDPSASRSKPQYQSKIVGESLRLLEEEIPRTGLRVRRIRKFAHGSGEVDHFWVGRHKDAGRGNDGSGLTFDYIEEDEPGDGTDNPVA